MIVPLLYLQKGSKYWYQEGKIHRENDKPAATFSDGTKIWYKEGKIHRENNQPAIIYEDGSTKVWYKNGRRVTREP